MAKIILIAVLLVSLGASAAQADIDWRAKGAVTAVQDQGDSSCNLSWAFSATGLVEGALVSFAGKPLVKLSEQQLIDCVRDCGGSASATACPDAACPPLDCAFRFIRANGLCSEADYPYTGHVGTCRPCTPVVPAGFATNWRRVEGESALQGALNQGPVVARLEIGIVGETLPSYLTYSTGVFSPQSGSTDDSVVQWVLVVGYTSQFWWVKNSLGTDWGMLGYMELVRGRNALGINNNIYVLQAGSPTTGACSLPDGSCVQTSPTDCSAANGSLGELGTICPAPCVFPIQPVPALSRNAIAGLALVLVIAGLALLIRKFPRFR